RYNLLPDDIDPILGEPGYDLRAPHRLALADRPKVVKIGLIKEDTPREQFGASRGVGENRLAVMLQSCPQPADRVLPDPSVEMGCQRARKVKGSRNRNLQLLHCPVHAVHVAANETAGGQRQLTPLDALDRVKLGGDALPEAVIKNQSAFVPQSPVALLLDEG